MWYIFKISRFTAGEASESQSWLQDKRDRPVVANLAELHISEHVAVQPFDIRLYR